MVDVTESHSNRIQIQSLLINDRSIRAFPSPRQITAVVWLSITAPVHLTVPSPPSDRACRTPP